MTIDPFTWFTLKCVAFGLLGLVVLFFSVYGVLKQLGIGTKPKGQIGTVVSDRNELDQLTTFRDGSYHDGWLSPLERQEIRRRGYVLDGDKWRKS